MAAAPQQTPGPVVPKSYTTRNVAILIILVVVLIIIFVAPIVPYTFGSYSYAGESVSSTGTVSISYALFKCGEVSAGSGTVTVYGYTETFQETAAGWAC